MYKYLLHLIVQTLAKSLSSVSFKMMYFFLFQAMVTHDIEALRKERDAKKGKHRKRDN